MGADLNPAIVEVDGESLRLLPAFHALRQIVWLLGPDGTVERLNPFWTEYTGLPGVTEGLAWVDVIHPEDRQRLINTRRRGVASRQPYEVEGRLRAADGRYRRHLCRVVPIWQAEELTGWVGTAIDVEQLRVAEDTARDSERRKARVLEAISEGYYRLDRGFRLIEVNAAFERLTGKTARDVVGQYLWTMFPDAPPLETYTRIPLGRAVSEERWSGAARRWVEITIYRSSDGFEAYFRDISDRRRAAVWQQSLTRIASELRQPGTNADRTTLAAGVVGEALGLVRAGYVHVDKDGEAHIDRDWVSSPTQLRSAGRYRIGDWGDFLSQLMAGDTVAIGDVEVDPRTKGAADDWRRWNVRALAFVPMLTAGKLEGYLMLHDDKPREWTDDELTFARTVSDIIWAAMHR